VEEVLAHMGTDVSLIRVHIGIPMWYLSLCSAPPHVEKKDLKTGRGSDAQLGGTVWEYPLLANDGYD
jgi:hypothetical protein